MCFPHEDRDGDKQKNSLGERNTDEKTPLTVPERQVEQVRGTHLTDGIPEPRHIQSGKMINRPAHFKDYV